MSECRTKPVIYTVNVGMYDEQRGAVRGVQCYAVSDTVASLRGIWTHVRVPEHADKALLSRLAKACPQLVLPSCGSPLIYHDANLELTPSDMVHISDRLRRLPNCQVVVSPHNRRRYSVDHEAGMVLKKGYEHAVNLKRCQNAQSAHRFQDDVGLSQCSVIVRADYDSLNVRKHGGTWWRGIQVCRRDQITFDYCAWKHNLRIERAWDWGLPRAIGHHPASRRRIQRASRPRTLYAITKVLLPTQGGEHLRALLPTSVRTVSDIGSATPLSEFLKPEWSAALALTHDDIRNVLHTRPDSFILFFVDADTPWTEIDDAILTDNLVEAMITSCPDHTAAARRVDHYVGEIIEISRIQGLTQSTLIRLFATLEHSFI
jgi:hypothetical protein